MMASRVRLVGFIKPCIQHAWDYTEKWEGDNTFIVKSPTVEAAIHQQQAAYKNRAEELYGGHDPHLGLKDLMSEGDKNVMNYIHTVRTDWSSLSMLFS